ncbi:MAG: PhoPQ-activated protein PqaA family protein [Armatimonadota bacterium]
MNRWILPLSIAILLSTTQGFCAKAGSKQVTNSPQTALDRYMAKPNPDFKWSVASEKTIMGTQFLELDMISQVWMDGLWTHKVVLIRPSEVPNPKIAILYITGGSISDPERIMMAVMARNSQAVVVALGGIPNQPLYDGLTEDNLIAMTFQKYEQTKNEEWPLLIPMTKSAVCAMTAAQAAAKKQWGMNIEKFLVTGGSKRGWTTWLTAAVDDRVAAIAPMVYDNLDIPRQMALQKSSYGKESVQIEAYTKLGLIDLLTTDKGKDLVDIVDPFNYRKRYTMPKLIVNGSNDPYWVFDSASLYFSKLSGTKRIIYAPNSGHGLDDRERVLRTISGFYKSVSEGLPLADITATGRMVGNKLTIKGTTTGAAGKVEVWVAVSPIRDFRQAKFVVAEAVSKAGRFEASIPVPAGKYVGWYADVNQQISQNPAHFSTVASVIER